MRTAFFNSVRKSLFNGSLDQGQVDGLNFLLDSWNETGFTDWRWLAYCLATAYHETAFTMQPIEEYGKGKGKRYGRKNPTTGKAYYGRGYVQLTWKYNYEKASRALGIDFVRKPHLVMEPSNAAFILYTGMAEGWFTTKRLSDYIKGQRCNLFHARKIVNGLDRAADIAGYAELFETAINAQLNEPEPAPEPPAKKPKGWLAKLIDAIMRVLFK